MKRTITLVALCTAFVAVSLWLALSGGRSTRATRAKFRIGGAILTIIGTLSMTSCVVSCYDPAFPETNNIDYPKELSKQGVELHNGDIVFFPVQCQFNSSATITLLDSASKELQSNTYTLRIGDSEIAHTINAGDYRGKATIVATSPMYQNDSEHLIKWEISVKIVD